MSMIPGSVTVNALGVATGAGLAKEMYDDYLPKIHGSGLQPVSPLAKQQLAELFNTVAQTAIAHIVAHAQATILSNIAVATTGTAAAQTGATTAPGTGTIS